MKPFNELSESGTVIEVQPVVAEVEEDRPSKPAEKPIQKPVAPAPAPLAPVTPVEQIANINSERGVFVSWPKKVMGLYILLADDDHEGLETVQDFLRKNYRHIKIINSLLKDGKVLILVLFYH